MTTTTIERAHGRWREILIALGVDSKFLTKKNGPCPSCGGTDRFSFTDRNGDGDYICRGCGAGKGVQLVMKLKGSDMAMAFKEVDKIIGNTPAPRREEEKANKAITPVELNKRWGKARMILSCPDAVCDPVGRYWEKRGLHLDGPSFDRVLRHDPVCYHWPSKTYYPAMVAKFCDADGKPKHLHTTFLTREGEKAKVERPRLYTPGELPKGGAIRLGPVEEVMGVATGIETALSASILYGMTVWATTSDAMLLNWKPPAAAKNIIVFGDNDENYAGQAAAYMLAKRLVNEAERDKSERAVLVRIPHTDGFDWNDFLINMPEPPSSFDQVFEKIVKRREMN